MKKLVALVFATSLAACSQGSYSGVASDSIMTGIIGGKLVQENDPIAKSNLAIEDMLTGDVCTGTLISKNLVITAAHCVENGAKLLKVHFGLDADKTKVHMAVKDLRFPDRYTVAMQEIDVLMKSIVDSTTPGPDRDNKVTKAMDDYKNWGDVAIIRLEADAPTGFEATEILDDARYVTASSTVTIAGYGISKPYSEQAPDEEEPTVLRKADIKVGEAIFSETEVSLDQSKGVGACHGDSGGPAYVKVGGKLKLLGVTSRGLADPKDTCKIASAYTFLPAWKTWIDTAVLELSKN